MIVIALIRPFNSVYYFLFGLFSVLWESHRRICFTKAICGRKRRVTSSQASWTTHRSRPKPSFTCTKAIIIQLHPRHTQSLLRYSNYQAQIIYRFKKLHLYSGTGLITQTLQTQHRRISSP